MVIATFAFRNNFTGLQKRPQSQKPSFMNNSSAVKAKINTEFSHLSDPAFGNGASGIQVAMTDNPEYLNPVPTMVELAAQVADYISKLSVAQNRDRNAVAAKNQARLLLTASLKNLGNYVTLTANGDRQKLIGSGFPISKQGEPVAPLSKPRNMVAKDGPNPGECTVSVDGSTEARSFLYQYTTDPITEGNVWVTESGTARSYTFTKMPRGITYWFRMGAVGTYGQLIYSDVVSRIVQ